MLDTPLYELSCQSNGAHCAFPTEFSLIQHLRVKPKILNLGKTKQSWKSAPATWELLDNTKSLKKLANERGITQSAGLGVFFFLIPPWWSTLPFPNSYPWTMNIKAVFVKGKINPFKYWDKISAWLKSKERSTRLQSAVKWKGEQWVI